MKLFLQMGHGMEKICRDLTAFWKGTTVILSPLNIIENKLHPFSQSILKLNGNVLFDPQLYTPRNYHKNLDKYSYWPQKNFTNIELGEYGEILESLHNINESIQSESFILPSNITAQIDNRWNSIQNSISNQSRKITNKRKIYHTIALKGNILFDETQVEKIIQYTGQWDIDGVYIVCEHPKRTYLIDNPLWITNLLSLIAGIKRQQKSVIVGYTNHQMLCLALAKCDAIAAGNYLNVRWFQLEHFKTKENDDETSRRSNWYYCPQAFSEYKVTYLDVAKRLDETGNTNLLTMMSPSEEMRNIFSKNLFEGAMPSSTHYKEGHSHRHYLHCLKVQCEQATRSSYKDTRDSHLALLETASHIISGLRDHKIKGQDRDFGEIIDVIEAAISVFDKEYGFPLSQEWDSL